MSEVSDVLDGPLPATGLPLSGIFVPYAAFFPCAHGLGYLVDGPFYLFFLVQRSINHARPGSSKVANRIILVKRTRAATRRKLRLFRDVYVSEVGVHDHQSSRAGRISSSRRGRRQPHSGETRTFGAEGTRASVEGNALTLPPPSLPEG